LLEHHTGLSAETIAKWRKTRGGEIPQIPGFEILGHSGTGGTADVFRAREKEDAQGDRAEGPEARIDAQRAHARGLHLGGEAAREAAPPGLVEGYGVMKSGNVYFSKMEFIEGHTLLELLDDDHRFDEKAALRVVLGVPRC
jgi:hypothetical protein